MCIFWSGSRVWINDKKHIISRIQELYTPEVWVNENRGFFRFFWSKINHLFSSIAVCFIKLFEQLS